MIRFEFIHLYDFFFWEFSSFLEFFGSQKEFKTKIKIKSFGPIFNGSEALGLDFFLNFGCLVTFVIRSIVANAKCNGCSMLFIVATQFPQGGWGKTTPMPTFFQDIFINSLRHQWNNQFPQICWSLWNKNKWEAKISNGKKKILAKNHPTVWQPEMWSPTTTWEPGLPNEALVGVWKSLISWKHPKSNPYLGCDWKNAGNLWWG